MSWRQCDALALATLGDMTQMSSNTQHKDIQHKDINHKDIQHKNIQHNDIQHYNTPYRVPL
jgi:hypothetical protein